MFEGSTKPQILAVFAVLLVVFTGAGIAANTMFTAENGVKVNTTNGPAVTLGEDTGLDGQNPVGTDDSVNVGILSVKGPAGSNVTVTKANTAPNITDINTNNGTVQTTVSEDFTVNVSDNFSTVDFRTVNTTGTNGTILNLSATPTGSNYTDLNVSWDGSSGYYNISHNGSVNSTTNMSKSFNISSQSNVEIVAKNQYCLNNKIQLGKNGQFDSVPSCVNSANTTSAIVFNDSDGNAVVNVTEMNVTNKSTIGSNVSQFNINKSSGNITVTISDLDSNRYYEIYEDGSMWKNVSSDSNGKLEFSKTSGWSKHSYNVTTQQEQSNPQTPTATPGSDETVTETEIGGGAAAGGGGSTTFTSLPIIGSVSLMQFGLMVAAVLAVVGGIVLYYRRKQKMMYLG